MVSLDRGPSLRRLIVSTMNLERAVAFYDGVLGVPLIRTHGDFAWLDLAAGQEMLLHRRHVERSDASVAAAFVVEHLSEVVEQWRSLGGVVLDEPATQPWGEVMAVVRDPDDHIVCLIQRPSVRVQQ